MMRLLFDHNLSPRLPNRLMDVFPQTLHVAALDLSTASDQMVWEYARDHDYIIVTKDADFSEMGVLQGFPPKVVWIRRGNCSTREIEMLLRENLDEILALSNDSKTGILALF